MYEFKGPRKDLGDLLVQQLAVDDPIHCAPDMFVPMTAVATLLYEKPLKDIKLWLIWYFKDRPHNFVQNERAEIVKTLKTHFMAVIQSHLNFIENVVTSDMKSSHFEEILYYILVCKPLFSVPGLGLENFLKKVKLKLIETIKMGLVLSFLMFCDWCPDYVSERVCPVFKKNRHRYSFFEIKEQRRRLSSNPVFRPLVENHWVKFTELALSNEMREHALRDPALREHALRDPALREPQYNLT